ncbi:MAG: MATE family efflux transporter, partial [Clostridia bacterium]|nr:MATE family efflux transporter [Clostridia bacterium]
MLNKFFGSKDFYARVMRLMLPIMIQNGITNLVNMLDNIMVGQVGTVQMNGVSVTNQLLFVFNLCVFGAVSGVGIFGSQYFGKGDHKGLRDTFRFKILFCVLLTVLCMALFLIFGDNLIGLYLKGEGSAGDAKASLFYAKQYLNIMLIGLIPCTIAQC